MCRNWLCCMMSGRGSCGPCVWIRMGSSSSVCWPTPVGARRRFRFSSRPRSDGGGRPVSSTPQTSDCSTSNDPTSTSRPLTASSTHSTRPPRPHCGNDSTNSAGRDHLCLCISSIYRSRGALMSGDWRCVVREGDSTTTPTPSVALRR